jgi:hypothetical protein
MLATVCQHYVGRIRFQVKPKPQQSWHYEIGQFQVLPRQSAAFSPILSG